jgi:hypothetical protein
MDMEQLLPPVAGFRHLSWTECATDNYGGLHVAAAYCGLPRVPQIPIGVWQHGCQTPWQQVQPEVVVYRAPREERCWVGRVDEVKYLQAAGYARVRAIGLPIIYTADPRVTRIPGSLLVMPCHAMRWDKFGKDQFERYVAQIQSIAGRFKQVVACVSPTCLANGFWAPQFQAAGIPVVCGAAANDANALRRMRTLFEAFDYVTTHDYGSHVVYGLAFGARVSIWGDRIPITREQLLQDATWAPFPAAVDRFLSGETERKADESLQRYRVEPWKAVRDIAWGRRMIGDDNKVSPEQMRTLFRWTPARRVVATVHWPIARTVRRLLKSAKKRLPGQSELQASTP